MGQGKYAFVFLGGFLFTQIAHAIVNGTPVKDASYASIFMLNNSKGDMDWHCSSVLVAPQLLLTAAHCVDPKVVNLGSSNNGKGVSANLGKANIHPSYVDPEEAKTLNDQIKSAAYDIGYVTLKKPVSAPLAPVQLTDDNAPAVWFQKTLTLVGFGPDNYSETEDGFGSFGTKRFGTKDNLQTTSQVMFFSGQEQSAVPGDSGGAVFSDGSAADSKLIAILSQFTRNDDGSYNILMTSLLRSETLCWVVKDSGVSIPGVTCQ